VSHGARGVRRARNAGFQRAPVGTAVAEGARRRKSQTMRTMTKTLTLALLAAAPGCVHVADAKKDLF